jgi:hypothetical protein
MGRTPGIEVKGTEIEHSWCHGQRGQAMSAMNYLVMSHVKQGTHEIKGEYREAIWRGYDEHDRLVVTMLVRQFQDPDVGNELHMESGHMSLRDFDQLLCSGKVHVTRLAS